MDVDGGSQDNGARVIQWDCHGNSNQQFRLVDVTGLPGYVQVVAHRVRPPADLDDVGHPGVRRGERRVHRAGRRRGRLAVKDAAERHRGLVM